MRNAPAAVKNASLPPFLDFFAGSGLVTEALNHHFSPVWANDIAASKAEVYSANHGGDHLDVRPLEQVRGSELPAASLAWASFPCQDLSLAGNLVGIDAKRSGLVWHWLRVLDQMASAPPLLVAENVVGLVSADGGSQYRKLHHALTDRGYRVGAVLLDAVHWLPQSRPRVFVIAVRKGTPVEGLVADTPGWVHSKSIVRAAQGLTDWVWWDLPKPRAPRVRLTDLVDADAELDPPAKSARNIALIPPHHQARIPQAIADGLWVFPGYKRIRKSRQVLELRFDGVTGCLRTPRGGSSRQHLVIARGTLLQSRLLTIREAARLMGASDSYKLPGTYNQAYWALGDAVAVPAVRFLAEHLLLPLFRNST